MPKKVMEPIRSTAEILALKSLGRSVNDTWITWAIDMVMAGFDTEHLVILAGESASSNQFYLQDLTDKVLKELNLQYADTDRVIKDYASYLIDKSIKGEIEVLKVLRILSDLHLEFSYTKYLVDFYLLYYAKSDLLQYGEQFYWNDADRSNIDEVIAKHFKNWIASQS